VWTPPLVRGEAGNGAVVTSERPEPPRQRKILGWTVTVLMMPMLFAWAKINELEWLARRFWRQVDD
jgi:hypothetical protein